MRSGTFLALELPAISDEGMRVVACLQGILAIELNGDGIVGCKAAAEGGVQRRACLTALRAKISDRETKSADK
jgi:hypothetical protein